MRVFLTCVRPALTHYFCRQWWKAEEAKASTYTQIYAPISHFSSPTIRHFSRVRRDNVFTTQGGLYRINAAAPDFQHKGQRTDCLSSSVPCAKEPLVTPHRLRHRRCPILRHLASHDPSTSRQTPPRSAPGSTSAPRVGPCCVGVAGHCAARRGMRASLLRAALGRSKAVIPVQYARAMKLAPSSSPTDRPCLCT